MLSIVIPVKNEVNNLPTLLRSVMAQSFGDFEVIVAVAPDTTDDSRAVAESFGARVTDGGLPGRGRNCGARVAKGDLLLFLDADTVLPDPWFLQMTVAEFEKRQLGVATCKVTPLSDRLIDKTMHEATNYFMWATQKSSPHAPGFCIFVQRAIFEAIGGFDESLKVAEDHDFVSRASKQGPFALLKTYRISVSVRRLDRDGRLNVALKYLLVEFYLATFGPIRTDIFKYRFAHFDEVKEKFGSRAWLKRVTATAHDAVNAVIEEVVSKEPEQDSSMLSVVIPVKNEAKNLPRILASIKTQTLINFEVIVAVSPDTTDDSCEVAASYGAKVVVGGMPGAGRNRGAAAAQGDLVLFLDADIVLPAPDFFEKTVAELKERRLGIATCLIQPLSSRLDDKIFHDIFNLYITMVADFSPHAPGFCIFVQKAVHDAINGFDEEIKLAEDHDYAVRASKVGCYGILKAYKIPVSVRRFERDGRLTIAMKMLLAEIYLQTKGNIKSDIFKYRFAHFDEPKKTTVEDLKEQLEQIAKLARARARKIGKALTKEVSLTRKPRPKKAAKKRKTTP